MRMISTAGLLCATLLLGCGPKEARSDVARDSKELVAPWTEMDLPFYGGEIRRADSMSLEIRWEGEVERSAFDDSVDRFAAAVEASGWSRDSGPSDSGKARNYFYDVPPDQTAIVSGIHYPSYHQVSLDLMPAQ